MAVEGRDIYNLTAGELAIDTPLYIQAEVGKTLHLNKYTPVAGLSELRANIAMKARTFYHQDWIESANVVVTAGVKPALYAALMAIINPGDEVIVPVPAWVSYHSLIELAGGVVVEVALSDSFDLDVNAVGAKITTRTKAIIINSPHNPTGSIFSQMSMEKMVDLLRDKAVTVIADDIYSKLVYDPEFVSIGSYDFDKLVIVNGFSKSQALTGWRIGYLIGEKEIAQAVANLLSHTMGNASVPSQQAALAALAQNDVPQALPQLIKQRQLVVEGLMRIPRLKYHLPGGAFYVFLNIRDITVDSAKWCEELLVKKGVALVPGEAFSAPGFARLSFVADEATLLKALALMSEFVRGD